jgi:hypothetical protein
MYPDTPQLPGLAGRLLKREAARWWWAPLVAGIIWFLIAWLVLRADVTSLATVGVLVGVVLLVAAATEGALGGIMTGGWKVLHYALAVLFLLGALWSFIRPVNTFFALASCWACCCSCKASSTSPAASRYATWTTRGTSSS